MAGCDYCHQENGRRKALRENGERKMACPPCYYEVVLKA